MFTRCIAVARCSIRGASSSFRSTRHIAANPIPIPPPGHPAVLTAAGRQSMYPQNRSFLSPLDALAIPVPVGKGDNTISNSNNAPAARYVATSIHGVCCCGYGSIMRRRLGAVILRSILLEAPFTVAINRRSTRRVLRYQVVTSP